MRKVYCCEHLCFGIIVGPQSPSVLSLLPVFCHEELACHMLPKEARETCDLGLELTKPGANKKPFRFLSSLPQLLLLQGGNVD